MKKKRDFFKKTHIKSHKGQKFSNPLFREKKPNVFLRVIMVVLPVILLIAGAVYLLYSPQFRVTEMYSQGLTTLDPQKVTQTAWNIVTEKKLRVVPATHKWFFAKDQVLAALHDEHNFSDVSLEVSDGTVIIHAEEKISELAWRVGRSFYFLNLEGEIIRELRPTEYNAILKRLNMDLSDTEQSEFAPLQPKMPIIEDKSGAEVIDGEKKITAGTAENILEFDKAVRHLAIQPLIYEIEKPLELWVRVKTVQDVDILIEGEGDPEEQVETLGVILNEYDDKLSELQYIDVRFGNRVFVK